MSTNLE